MFTYWRIFEELKSMGEVVIFHDPSLARNYDQWLQKHAEAIAWIYGYKKKGRGRPTLH